jgi:C-terminal processing protease CtpA/Prc
MYKDQWNKEVTDYFVERNGANFFNRYFRNEPDNLGTLQRVYVLTSRSTASASELVINSLLPYMEVIVIGDNTAGKNVGSITIQDENKRWEWGLQPIVLKTLNALGQSDYGTVNGFTPNIVQRDNVLPFQPFASENETLFRLALEHITQKPVASTAAARLRAQRPMPQASREFISDNPLENRKEMWITELPK